MSRLCSRSVVRLPLLLLITLLFLIPSTSGVSAKWRRQLSCPTYCAKQVDPVCGTDGIIYNNDCERRKKTCGSDVDKAEWSLCRVSSGLTKCKHQCSKEVDLVCGTDSRTYINLCYLQVDYCQRGIKLSHYGGCNNGTEIHQCPETCAGASRDGPICGSDGNVYKTVCQMQIATCGQGVVSADKSHCMTTKHCKDGCMRVSHITCGSDGKLYNNGCQMRRKNCGRHVYEVPAPFCLNKLYRTKCPVDCSKAKQKPVCGSDGELYGSMCELRMMTCGYPLIRYEKVQVVPLKKCTDKINTCKKMECSTEVKYVCGNDGVTYRNLCDLQEATCRAGVQQSHQGPCADLTKPPSCPKNCSGHGDSLVCASDGNVYRNECEMQKATCKQRIVVAALDQCQTTEYCRADCSTFRGGFVCGNDRNLYKNECEMRKHHCGKHSYVLPMSKCLSGFNFSGCGRICPPNYDPVCGTDGKTYLSNCFMEQESCRARSLGGVGRKHYGKCGAPEKRARNYLYRR